MVSLARNPIRFFTPFARKAWNDQGSRTSWMGATKSRKDEILVENRGVLF
jgi:hypothetical protein